MITIDPHINATVGMITFAYVVDQNNNVNIATVNTSSLVVFKAE